MSVELAITTGTNTAVGSSLNNISPLNYGQYNYYPYYPYYPYPVKEYYPIYIQQPYPVVDNSAVEELMEELKALRKEVKRLRRELEDK